MFGVVGKNKSGVREKTNPVSPGKNFEEVSSEGGKQVRDLKNSQSACGAHESLIIMETSA